ncbi:MAG: hypothetical protein FJ125_13960, partial [Deltaproteobacteria bacterium]|nr:hypothetical protein [Deltaproteobacteria bacterium]
MSRPMAVTPPGTPATAASFDGAGRALAGPAYPSGKQSWAARAVDLPRLHKLGCYALTGLAIASLWLGNAFGAGLGLPLLLVAVASWFWEPPRVDPDRFQRGWTVLTLLVLGLLVYLGFTRDLGIVNLGVYFVLYLTMAKLYQRSRLADHEQILALSLLLMA